MVKSILLQDGEEIFVDDEDYERVSQHVWYKTYNSKSGRNSRNILTVINEKKVCLPNFIKKGSFQKNKGNDFTRKNLTTTGNHVRWAKAKYNNSSRYKGVSWNKKNNKWATYITVEEKLKYLGQFVNEDDAARAYNKAVLDYWDGEGYLNVIGRDNRTLERDYKTKERQNNRRVGVSGFKGVYILNSSTYRVNIKFKRKASYVKSFPTPHHAALAYNKCAIYLHGDDAILNDVPMTDELKEFISNWEIPQKILDLKK